MPARGKSTMNLVDLLLSYLDDFVPAVKTAENPDLALRDVKMLCEQFDDRQVGFAFPGRLFYSDYVTIAFRTDLFGSGIGLYLNLDSHLLSVP